jgi:hypothetical protein
MNTGGSTTTCATTFTPAPHATSIYATRAAQVGSSTRATTAHKNGEDVPRFHCQIRLQHAERTTPPKDKGEGGSRVEERGEGWWGGGRKRGFACVSEQEVGGRCCQTHLNKATCTPLGVHRRPRATAGPPNLHHDVVQHKSRGHGWRHRVELRRTAVHGSVPTHHAHESNVHNSHGANSASWRHG